MEDKTIDQCLFEAYAEIEDPSKDSKNPHFKNTYASLSQVLDCVKPVLASKGLILLQIPDGDMLKTCVKDSHGQEIVLGDMPIVNAKGDAQGYGSGLSYARRYSLMCIFGLVAEDDDGQKAKPLGELEKLRLEIQELGSEFLRIGGNADMILSANNNKRSNEMNLAELKEAKTKIQGLIRGYNMGEPA